MALSFEGAQLRYGELFLRCERLAAQLWHDWGVRPGDRVAWLGANHPGQLVLLFALARIGAILLPLNFRLSPASGTRSWPTARPRIWCTTMPGPPRRRSLGRGGASPCIRWKRWRGRVIGRAPPQAAQGPVARPAGLHLRTTSRAKAAVHTQANLLANMAIASRAQQMTAQDVIATMLPLFHVGGLCIQTLPALYVGAHVILHPRFAADAALDCFERDRPTLTLQVPATMKALIEHPRWESADLASLRAVWAGSSLLPAGLVQAFHARGLPVCNVYGATETGPFSIALAPEHARSHAGSCGWPAPGVDVHLCDIQDGVGELLIRGPNVISHYWPAQPACDGRAGSIPATWLRRHKTAPTRWWAAPRI